MTRFSVELPDKQARRLVELASEAGLTPEQLLGNGITQWLDSAHSDFAEAAEYVLRKNAALYKRLA